MHRKDILGWSKLKVELDLEDKRRRILEQITELENVLEYTGEKIYLYR